MDDKSKVQFLSLDSNVWKFSQSQSRLVADFLARGSSISRVFCRSMLKGACIPLEEIEQATSLSGKELDALCLACKKRTDLVVANFDAEALYLDDYLDARLYEQYVFASSKVDSESWSKFSVDNFEIGKISAYEFFLKHKLDSEVIPQQLFGEYSRKLQSVLKVMASAPDLLNDRFPDFVISYNHLYSQNNIYTQIANRKGIGTFSIQYGDHSSERLQTLNMFKTTRAMLSTPSSETWKAKTFKMPSLLDVDKTVSHFQGLITGQSGWTYSRKIDGDNPLTKLGIVSERPVVLVTLSSDDEIYSAGLVDSLPETGFKDAFPNQIDFLLAVLEAASLRKDLNFVIRVHPRMLANKRDSRNASSLNRIKLLIDNSPENVIGNWPSDNVSIYDLFRITKVGLNYRSQTGYEMLACGIPVVVALSKFHIRPIDGFFVAESPLDIVEKIQQALSKGSKVENALPAFRWYGFVFNTHVASVSGSPSFSISSIRPKNNGNFLAIWRALTKFFQLKFPLVIEKWELRKIKVHDVDPRFFEVISKNLEGLHMTTSANLNLEPASIDAVKVAANQIRKMVGLENL